MGKLFIRVDDRLIHGQTLIAWCPTLKIQEIIAVDDVSAKNAMLKSIMTMSVPKDYNASVVTIMEAKEKLQKESTRNRLLIVKYPTQLLEIKDEIINCDGIVLGNMAKREDTPYNLSGAQEMYYLSDDDVKAIDNLIEAGISVKFQQLPTSKLTEWESFRKSI